MIKNIIKKILPNSLIILLKNIIDTRTLKSIKANFKNISYTNSTNILSELCEKHGSDKGFVNINAKKPFKWTPHTYTSYYHSIFNLSRENIKFVFECGLGTNNPEVKSNMTKNGIPGASLRVWKDYFVNANIYGGDIDKNILFEEDRIKTFYVDQLDTNSIKSLWEKINVESFDIIIDDGLHETEANLNFFFNSFQKVKKNGVYIIEDVANSELNYLQYRLRDYETDVVTLHNRYKKVYIDNNLVVIKKTY